MLHPLNRRTFLGTLAAAAGYGIAAPSFAAARPEFSFDQVRDEAKALARRPYNAPYQALPERYLSADFETYRRINFRSKAALWRGSREVEAQFFHPGHYYRRGIEVASVEGGKAIPVKFDADDFRYRGIAPPSDGENLQFSGFRLHTDLNDKGYKDEYAVFQGGSYFRLLGKGQVYGASGRGLAVNTALASGEEFPHFRKFWLIQPEDGSTDMQVFAVLDGPSLTGAYKFELSPGDPTRLSVDAVLYFRKDVEKLGLAPLTSMFFKSKAGDRDHDSDGLLIHNGAGEELIRPLHNPGRITVSSFFDKSPRAFGLLQRHRVAKDFGVREYFYHRRPSFWVKPRGDWGGGHVELLELPTNTADYDNISAYWVPKTDLNKGREFSFAYDLDAGGEPETGSTFGRLLNSRHTPSGEFSLTFAGDETAETPDLSLSSTAGRIMKPSLARAADRKFWIVRFGFQLPEGGVADLRCRLEVGGRPVTETWTFPYEKGIT